MTKGWYGTKKKDVEGGRRRVGRGEGEEKP